MPTPYGSRGAMAFSADELRVLRRALAIALQPAHVPASGQTEELQEMLRLADAVDEVIDEGGRLRAFLRADLARYRAALPGAAVGYLERLQEALSAGYVPGADDLAALRALRARPAGPAEAGRRSALLHRCEALAEQSPRQRLAGRTRSAAGAPVRLIALPGGRGAADDADESDSEAGEEPAKKPEPQKPGPAPAREPQRPPSERRGRPVPTPAEVFPPRRRTPGRPTRPEERVAG